jgi:hypothetical protein
MKNRASYKYWTLDQLIIETNYPKSKLLGEHDFYIY